MSNRKWAGSYIGCVLFSLAVTPQFSHASDDSTLQFTAELDLVAPIIQHQPVVQSLISGESATISATVTDQSGVQKVSLFFRSAGKNEYTQVDMILVRDSLYTIIVPSMYIQGSALEYYIKAVDVAGNTVLRGLRFSPMKVAINGQDNPGESSKDDSDIAPSLEKVFGAQVTKKQKWLLWGLGVVAVGLVAYSIRTNGSNSEVPTTIDDQ